MGVVELQDYNDRLEKYLDSCSSQDAEEYRKLTKELLLICQGKKYINILWSLKGIEILFSKVNAKFENNTLILEIDESKEKQ